MSDCPIIQLMVHLHRMCLPPPTCVFCECDACRFSANFLSFDFFFFFLFASYSFNGTDSDNRWRTGNHKSLPCHKSVLVALHTHAHSTTSNSRCRALSNFAKFSVHHRPRFSVPLFVSESPSARDKQNKIAATPSQDYIRKKKKNEIENTEPSFIVNFPSNFSGGPIRYLCILSGSGCLLCLPDACWVVLF